MWNPRVGGEKYYTFFSALQADSSDSSNDTKTAPASCYGNRGGSFALFVLFQALTQLLAGVLDSSLSGCQNYRAFVLLHHDINHYRMTFLERSTKK